MTWTSDEATVEWILLNLRLRGPGTLRNIAAMVAQVSCMPKAQDPILVDLDGIHRTLVDMECRGLIAHGQGMWRLI